MTFRGKVTVLPASNRCTTPSMCNSPVPVEVALEPETSGCQAEARVRMLDQWVKPERAFIEILERDVLIPKIRHVDLRGRRPDGSVVCERLTDAGQPGRPCPSGE